MLAALICTRPSERPAPRQPLGVSISRLDIQLPGNRQVTNWLPPPGFSCARATRTTTNDALRCTGNLPLDTTVTLNIRMTPGPVAGMGANLYVLADGAEEGPFPLTGPSERLLPDCTRSGSITSVEPFGCFGADGHGYIGWSVYGAPGTTFDLELEAAGDVFGGASFARGTGTVPASGELYTGVSVESRGLLDARFDAGGTSSVTLTVDTSEDLPQPPEEAAPVCQVF